MKIKILTLTAIIIISLIACSTEKTLKLPLEYKSGYGYFTSALGGISFYTNDENNSWKKTYLSVSGVPKDWTDIKNGHIETNIYQSVYQNYLQGNITKERYEELQNKWNWKPDTLELSKNPIKTKIAFAIGTDTSGITKMIVDVNNNLDFSDDKSFIPYKYIPTEKADKDSIALKNAINVSFERWVNNQKQMVTVPTFITYMSKYNIYMKNFAQYAVAEYNGNIIGICSDNFTNLSYENPSIVVLSDSLKNGDKINNDLLVSKNGYIEINGKVYKNIGVKINSNKLVLEKMNLPKSKLFSTQLGYQSFPFEGKDFMTNDSISSAKLKGKYVLLDFWAVWCGPCIKEIPNLKDLYNKTDRDKFEIVGIIGDSPSDYVKKIIEKDSITWPQIISNDSNKIKETFGIHSYPTTLLINPEGVIIAKNLRGKKLEKRILDLIKK